MHPRVTPASHIVFRVPEMPQINPYIDVYVTPLLGVKHSPVGCQSVRLYVNFTNWLLRSIRRWRLGKGRSNAKRSLIFNGGGPRGSEGRRACLGEANPEFL